MSIISQSVKVLSIVLSNIWAPSLNFIISFYHEIQQDLDFDIFDDCFWGVFKLFLGVM